MAIDLKDFSFISLGPKDRVVYRHAASRSVPGTDWDEFTITHGVTVPFVPVVRFSVDGGTTWLYAGDIWVSGIQQVLVSADANNTQIRMNIRNRTITRTIHYEIWGIARDV